MNTGSRTPTLRVLVADDDDLYADMLAAAIAVYGGLELVDRARTGVEAVTRALARRPDVVLMDCFMPQMDGFEATRFLLNAWHGACVVMLTSSDDPGAPRRARTAGAVGFVRKSEPLSAVVAAVRAAGGAGEAVGGAGGARAAVGAAS